MCSSTLVQCNDSGHFKPLEKRSCKMLSISTDGVNVPAWDDRFVSGARKDSLPLSLTSSHGAAHEVRPYSSADCSADHPSAEELEREKSVATGAIVTSWEGMPGPVRGSR